MLREDLGPSVEAHSRRWELIVNAYLDLICTAANPGTPNCKMQFISPVCNAQRVEKDTHRLGRG